MNRKADISLFFLSGFYLLLHLLQSYGIGPELIRFYGKDIILIPFLILGINAANEILKLKLKISPKELIITTVYCIVAFEFVFPNYGMAFEADSVDILCYIFGAILSYFVFFKSAKGMYVET